MFAIVLKQNTGKYDYLAWQDPGYNAYGYFWTTKKVFNEIRKNSTLNHPFIFKTRKHALKICTELNLIDFDVIKL